MAQDYSRHHIVPRSAGGSNVKSNLVKLTHKYHVAFHQVFNNLSPHEQIGRVINISNTALTEDFKQEILKILDKDSEYIYERGILIRNCN